MSDLECKVCDGDVMAVLRDIRGAYPPGSYAHDAAHAALDAAERAGSPGQPAPELAAAMRHASDAEAAAIIRAAAIIAQAAPAPGPAGCDCGHAQTGHAFSDDVCAVPECPCTGYRKTPRSEAAALRDGVTALAARLDASAGVTRPSRKSDIESELAIALRQLLE